MNYDTFKVGDKAVYPAHGVIEIVAIESKMISGNEEIFYVLSVLDTNKTIMVPLEKVKEVGLRKIADEKEVREVFELLNLREIKYKDKNWNRRYRKYLQKIKTGSLKEIAEVLRDLYLIRAQKFLSFGEKKLLEMVKSIFLKEISIIKEIDESFIETELNQIFPPPKEEIK